MKNGVSKMVINLKKVLCSAAVGALLVCSNAYAGTVDVTNSSGKDLVLTVKGDKGKIMPQSADKKLTLKSKETTTINVSADDVEATTYELSAEGMTNGGCMNLATDSDYTATFSDAKVGTNCVSQKK